MTHLYLIRHGEATTQVRDILHDDGLTELGVLQAERLRDRLAATQEIKADVLIASTLPRARQTAEIIAPVFNLPIHYTDDVQELRLGAGDGLTIKEAIEKFGEADFTKYPFRPVAPGGEYWGQFVLRVSKALDDIIHQYEGKTIVVVCHGGIIDCSFLYFFNMGTLAFPRTHFFTTNTSITYWRQEILNDQEAYWRLVYYNDNLHVRDIEASQRIPWEIFQSRTPPDETRKRYARIAQSLKESVRLPQDIARGDAS